MAKGEPHTTPLPKQPCKKKIELDESTPYREIRYDPANKKSLERNLQVVTRDLNDFAAQPGNFDPEDPLGPEVSRKVREARAARFEMREHLEKIDRAERIAHEQRKQAREDAKFHAEQEKKRLRNKAAERDWPKRLSRDITPPSTSVKEARECFDEIRQERGGKNPYAARDWEADERRDRKKAEEEKGEREEQERRERFAASYKRSRMPFVPGRGRAPRHSGAGEGGDGSPKRPSRAPATGESRRRSSAPGRDASR